MAYFGRTPKKPGQLGGSGAGRTLAGFGPASGDTGQARAVTGAPKGRTARPDTPARTARVASAGRTARNQRGGR